MSAALFLLAWAVFLPALRNGFVNFDDDVYVYDNIRVRQGLTWANLQWAFTTLEAGFWHPLTWCSLFVDQQLFGSRAGGWHFTSLLLHSFNTILLFLLLRRMTGALWRSAFVAALFAVHPLHVEPVVWVASRKDVLSTFFWMLSLLSYHQYAASTRRWGLSYLLALAFFLCGLMSKAMVVTLPVILLLMDWWPLRRIAYSRDAWSVGKFSRLILEKVPFFAASLICGLLTVRAEKHVGALATDQGIPLEFRAANAAVGSVWYLWRSVWPEGLAPFYPFPPALALGPAVAAAGAIIAITALAFFGARRWPFLLFGWAWYGITLLPVCGLIQVGSHARADRYSYIPLIGIFVLATWSVEEVARRRRWPAGLLAAAASVVLIGCWTLTARQISYWRDSVSLFTHTLRVTSNNHFAHNNLGLALLDQNRADDAIDNFQAAIRIDAAYAKPHNNLGVALLYQGLVDDAIAEFEKALAIQPDFAEVCYNYGIARLRQTRYDDARKLFQQALRLQPDLARASYGLGSALLRSGSTDAAIAQFRRTLAIDPVFSEAHHDLGLALLRAGSADAAAAEFGQALQARPDSTEASYNLGVVLVRQRRYSDAVPPLENALRLNPALVEAHEPLGAALLHLGKTEAAIIHLQAFIAANPAQASAQNDLAGALLSLGRTREALRHFEAASAQQTNNPVLLNNIAWILATSPDATLRNGARAVALARRADAASGGADASILGTLAAACAESGDFPNAVSAGERALQLANSNPALAEALRAQLAQYRSLKPFRDPALATTSSPLPARRP